MFEKILRSLFTIVGLVLGYLIGEGVYKTEYISKIKFLSGSTVGFVIFLILSILIFGFIAFLISPWISKIVIKIMDYVENNFQQLSASEILFGTAGAILGLIIAFLIFYWVARTSAVGTIIAVIGMVVMAALGANTGIKKKEDLLNLTSAMKRTGSNKEKKNKNGKGEYKVLDTSVIIDGRIFDICQTGFIEGILVIPNFVLGELRHIADSSDSLKRNRGRRGLDVLNKIQKELNIEVEIYEKDFPDIAEVDSKLLKLAQVLGGKVITNDYNLNKVAEFQKVPVLNINELANAVKPVVLPGEEMQIQIIKDGKESNQGIAYLDDGTMIVVEGAKKHIGEPMDVVVTSVLQTAAGRMIFAKRKEDI